MSKYENQHFVPQFYLRGWATNESAPFFQLSCQKERPPTPIRKLCSDEYFNTLVDLTVLEKKLGDLEEDQALPINRLRDGRALTGLTTKEHLFLQSYLLTQRFRTRVQRSDLYRSGGKLLEDAVEQDLQGLEIDDDTFDQIKSEWVEESVVATQHFLMIHGIIGVGVSDLKAVVLRNDTDLNFVTSDAPVILDNPYYKDKRRQNYPGLANRGLMIYCPIDPDQLLILYDPKTYIVRSDETGRLNIDSPSTVRTFNMLQVLNSESFLIMEKCGQQDYIRTLVKDTKAFERPVSIQREYEFEDTVLEVEHEPNYRMPEITPIIDGIDLRYGIEYETQRNPRLVEFHKEIVYRIMNNSESTTRAGLRSISFVRNEFSPGGLINRTLFYQ